MALELFVGLYRDLSPQQRDAYLDLVVPRFLALAHPTPADFGRFFGVTPGTPAYHAKRAAVLDHARHLNVANAVEAAVISLVTARLPDGRPVTLAAQQIVRGAGYSRLADTIGQPSSSLPTHRMFHKFRYPPTSWLDPYAVTEAAVGEFARLVVANHATVEPLVATGALSVEEARAVLGYGMYAVVAAAYCRDQETAPAPTVYLMNTRPRLVRVVRRLGLHWHGLYAAGVEPAPRMRDPRNVNFPFWDWATLLQPHVPAPFLPCGIAPAVAYLARRQPDLLATLPLSLPYALPNNATTRATMERWQRRYRLTET